MRFSLFFLFFGSAIFAQNNYPKDYFRSPLDIPMQLSGNFGELRPNHFHAGFDLKTNQQEGLKVYAIADGYISRIRISTFGSGKTIYITHSNGFTSVYGHLQRAVPEIETIIKKAHYKEKMFEIDEFFKPNEISITKGQQIAFSGNTGSSEGPHLHFEIRDSKTENIINPMFFGYDSNFKDTKKPVISNLYMYPLEGESSTNHFKSPVLLNMSLQKDGTYLAENVVANGKIGFGINTFDYDDVSFNKNGVFEIKTFYNGKSIFGYQFNTFSYDEMRYINALIDYSKYKKTQTRVQKLFMKTPYNFSLIHTDSSNGIITATPNLSGVYRIEVSDYFGNKNTVTIPIRYNLLPIIADPAPPKNTYFLKQNKDASFAKNNATVFFPTNTFYDDFYLKFDVKNDTLYLHDDTVPVHTAFTISMENDKLSTAKKQKTFIGLLEGKKISYNATYIKENTFTAKSKTLGTYALVTDTIAPKISISKPIDGLDISSQKTVQFTINDDLAGIRSFNGYLNGNWILFEYDNKTKKITHQFSDGIVADGKNNLKLIVVDNVGNTTTFETNFFKK